jgi:hypothetical protein
LRGVLKKIHVPQEERSRFIAIAPPVEWHVSKGCGLPAFAFDRYSPRDTMPILAK